VRRIRSRKNALAKVSKIEQRADACVVIHYSCESFFDKNDGKTPRATSIAVRNLATGQTLSFSIHKIAEQKKIANEDIVNNFDILEFEMLNEFYAHVETIKHCVFLHWNMRDINYGFQALEHRYKVLGGTPGLVPEDKRYDFSRALIAIFGVSYIGHPRLEKLMELNHITSSQFLKGAEEAKAFDDREFVKLHQSRLRKADVLANLFERLADGTLKTRAKWKDTYGISGESVVAYIKQHWLYALVGVAGTVVATVSKIMGLF
jgi:hypothetical protein